jgi:hypothetical protein
MFMANLFNESNYPQLAPILALILRHKHQLLSKSGR